MERIWWKSDQDFQTSKLLGVSAHIMYLLSTGRNAWQGVWSQRYKGPTSLHFSLAEAKKSAEGERVQGTVFTIEQVPALAFRCSTGIAYCVEFHSQESFKMLDWAGDMNFLKIGAAMPAVMDVFSKPDPSAWKRPQPNEDSFVTSVYDLVGDVNHSNGKTRAIEVETLDNKAKLSRWKSHPNGTDNLGWTLAESDRDLTSTHRVFERFNSLNSPQLKHAANGLFVSAENFAKAYFEENWVPPNMQLEAALAELGRLTDSIINQKDD